MKIFGRVIKDAKIAREAVVDKDNKSVSYTDLLEECFVDVCRDLDIPVPLWLKKNTREFVSYRRTFFASDQFVEKVNFDRFEIRVE